MNHEIAKILYEMAMLLDMKGVSFKPRAFEKAAHSIESLQEDVKEIYKRGGLKALEDIPGIGAGIAARIEEYIKTKHVKDYDRLRKQIPVNIQDLASIEGLGPKTILKLYKKLDVKNRKQLEKAIKDGKLRDIKGFGEKTEQHILRGIDFIKESGDRSLLGFIYPIAEAIVEKVRKIPGIKRAEFAGSIRRMQETVGDLDILAISDDPEKVMDHFVALPEVLSVIAKGPTKSSVHLKIGMQADLRVVPLESYGAALQYFTGDKYHNVQLRQLAIKQGYKLNEYGLYKGKKSRSTDRGSSTKSGLVAGQTEEEIYEKLGLKWMPPEIRTNSGELDAAKEGKLPDLIGYDDLKGDLQVQTDWTDGRDSILEMAQAAKKMGLEYICITDHTKTLAMTGGSNEKKLLEQMVEIDKVQKKIDGIKILKGAEVNILKDGSLDIDDEVLAKLDVVGASVHSFFHLTEKEQTARIIKAMENPNVDIIFHPTGRLINRRPPYKVDVEALLAAAKRTKTVIEIDAYSDRLDLKDEYIRKAIDLGVKLSIDSDAHAAKHFQYLKFGIAQARRGWAEKKDIINAHSLDQMLKMLK